MLLTMSSTAQAYCVSFGEGDYALTPSFSSLETKIYNTVTAAISIIRASKIHNFLENRKILAEIVRRLFYFHLKFI